MKEDEHIDPNLEINLETVKKRAVKGILVLTGRTFFLSFLSLAATAALTVLLSPSDFGIFWIVSAVVNFLAYFSDVGLAASLIQSKENPNRKELKTTFTIQLGLVLILLLVLFLLTPYFVKVYSLNEAGKYLLYSLGLSLLFSSLKTIPSVLLERQLEFEKLVFPQVIETLVYNATVVFFAWKGFGITSFTYGVLLRGLVGLVLIYVLKPWLPGFAFSFDSLKKLLKFGLPYQINSFLATIKDDGLTAFLGGILGSNSMGLLGWAQKWGQAPLRFFMDHVVKVTFPAFSRMQDDKNSLERSVSRSIFFICFLVFPSVFALIVLAPLLVKIVPRYEKWIPALMPLFIISIGTILSAVTTQLTNVLNSTGRIKVTFTFMVFWTVLSWIFIPYLAYKFGVNGAALGYLLVTSTSIFAIFIVRKFVKFEFVDPVLKPLFASFVMGLIMFILRTRLSETFMSFWILVITGLVSYFVVSYVVFGISLLHDVRHSIKSILGKE